MFINGAMLIHYHHRTTSWINELESSMNLWRRRIIRGPQKQSTLAAPYQSYQRIHMGKRGLICFNHPMKISTISTSLLQHSASHRTTGPQDSLQNLRWSPPGDSWESRSFDPWWLHWWPDGCTVHKTRSKSAGCPFKTPSFAAIGPLVPWCPGIAAVDAHPQCDPMFWFNQ